jgi:D-alanyl-D-alanine carboxypeptidase
VLIFVRNDLPAFELQFRPMLAHAKIQRAIALSTLIVLLTLPQATFAAEPEPLSPDTQRALEAAVMKELKAYGGKDPIPGAIIGVWIPGKAPFMKGIGLSDISSSKPIAIDDKVRVGSNTKTFVVTVLLQLIDEKKLALDDTISKFDLGVKVPNADKITVRQLCQMESGLPDVYNVPEMDKIDVTVNSKFTPKELVDIAGKQPPLFAPGAKWNYSNTNYLLLGMIIEKVSGHTVADEIKNRLLIPLDLKNTTYPITDPAMPTPFSHGYALDKTGHWEDNTVSLPPSLTGAAGVMVSDMADMKKWVKAYVIGANNSPATQKERLTCVSIGKPGLYFGLGVGCSGGWFGYTGGIPGYNTGAYYLPAKDATIIAFVNSQQEKPGPGVANSIVRDFTQILFPENVVFPTPSEPDQAAEKGSPAR